MIIRILIGSALGLLGTLAVAQERIAVESRMEARVHREVDPGESLAYRQFTPRVEEGKSYPLLVFLHGYGERGRDNRKQLKHCAADIIAFIEEEEEPCFFLMPQCPDDMRWVRYVRPMTEAPHRMDRYPTLPLQLVERLIEAKIAELPIDPRRVYIAGLSMGGFATWELLSRRPDLFAGAVAICGGGDPRQVARFRDIPIRVFHGSADRVVAPSYSRVMVEALREAGAAEVIYTEYEGVEHDSWTQTCADREVWRWLFAKSRGN